MIHKSKKIFTAFMNRHLLLAVFVALFFTMAMTWVEMDPFVDHQRNVDFLRQNSQPVNSESTTGVVNLDQANLVSMNFGRQTDGLVFGSALLVVIIVGGVIINIRNI